MLTVVAQQDTDDRKTVGRGSHWAVRVGLKWLAFLAVTFLVLFPNPSLFARHVSRLLDLQAMIDPDAPELAPWVEEFQSRLAARKKQNRPQVEGDPPIVKEDPPIVEGDPPIPSDRTDASTTPRVARLEDESPPAAVQREVQTFIYEKVKYNWDWEVWGAADYLPTVGEMFAKAARREDGQVFEDCDGRAVMAASLMRRLGYEASVVTDLRHVWVTTPQGEWMGPGRRKTVVSSPRGNSVALGTVWTNIPVSLSYGVSVFPLGRELIILATAFVLLVHRRVSRRAAALAGLLLLQGLLFMRCGVLSADGVSGFRSSWPAVVGLLHLSVGSGLLTWASHRARRAAARSRLRDGNAPVCSATPGATGGLSASAIRRRTK